MTNFLKCYMSFLLHDQTQKEVTQMLDREREKEEAKQAAARLEGKDLTAENLRKVPSIDKEKQDLFALFIQAIVWGCGATLLEPSRKPFSDFLLALLNQESVQAHPELKLANLQSAIPAPAETIFDVVYDPLKKQWNLWITGKEYKVPRESQFHEIFIPTPDSARHYYVLKKLLIHDCSSLLYGKTGTGKTIITKKLLINGMQQSYISTFTSFSATIRC